MTGRIAPRWLFPAATAVLAALYLLQTVTPLRLDTDSLNYLIMGTAIADGRPVPPIGLPTGYSEIIALLDRAGIASSFHFVLANCVFLGVGLFAVWTLLGSENERARQAVVILTLFSFTIVRSIAMPMPEPAFFCVSLVAIALLCRSQGVGLPARMVMIAAAIGLTILAVSLRIIGLALVPAILWASFSGVYRQLVASRSRLQVRGWVAGTVAVVAAVAIVIIGVDTLVYYAGQARLMYPQGITAGRVYKHLSNHFVTIGELVVNLPYAKFRQFKYGFMIVGLAAVVALLKSVRVRGPFTPLHVYAVIFVGVLIAWPHHAARLWMPVIPVIIALIAMAELTFRPGPRSLRVMRAWLAWFAVTGMAALAYTTRISLAGDNFASTYGIAGGMSTKAADGGPKNEKYDREARELMRRYGR